ncbi:MAG: hypothetical protein IT342_10755 [Candidatus Melainabacteria bacterium]|nr:hypothetical protein [Candidatus Melainabacteria bacterium]
MTITPPDIQYSDKGSSKKAPIIMAMVVAVVAAGISIWGVNTSGLTAGIPSPQAAQPAPAAVAPPADREEEDRLLKAGARLHQERCAGCHAIDSKLIGPSYSEICRKYGESVEIPGSPAPGVTDQISSTVLSAISFATTHPSNVWDAYDRGPQLSMTEEERRAVAFWIFNNSKDEEEKDE